MHPRLHHLVALATLLVGLAVALPAVATAAAPGATASRTESLRTAKTQRVRITVRVGDLCSQTTAALRSTRRGLVYP